MPAVLCQWLRKRYGPHEALRGLDLEVPEGSLFGFLGPNGAGKSTTLRILAGLVRADGGRAELHGVDARRHVAAAARTTFLIENAVFPAHLTARETLRRAASLMRVEADEAQLERVGLAHARDRRTGGFSHGMRQRLGLACALLGKPDLLVLDEPQNGLDPQGLRTIREILREENARGATVLVSVHRLAEVEGLCTHAALIVAGRAVRAGPVESLLADGEPRYRIVVSDTEAAARAIALPCEAGDGALVFRADRERAAAAAAACVRAGVKVFSLEPLRRTLDELYLDEIGGAGGP
ncbi:MAG: ABC transporter ATP-binding protein [Planctomycetes bacterium]|nr:ABC transporter ATP-binding protein [Planctomycetota bacterium]